MLVRLRAVLAIVLTVALAVPAWAVDMSNSDWSETDSSNNQTPPAGWPAGMNPSQVEPTARAMMGALKRWWNRQNPVLSTTGSAGAYVLTPADTSYPSAYVQGETFCAKANFTSVGSDTLNVNSLGALPFYKPALAGPVEIGAGDIQSGQMFCAAYDAALNSGAGGFQGFYGVGTIATGLPQSWTAGQSGGQSTSSISTSTFTIDLDAGNHFVIDLVHASCPCTIASPSNLSSRVGQTGIIEIVQSSTGSDTVSWNSVFKFYGGTAPTLSAAASNVDEFAYYVRDATHVDIGMYGLNFH